MAFPIDLTSTLTGNSPAQLSYWRRSDFVLPEISTKPRVLYSFRDLLALRTVAKLRNEVSLQAVRKAFASLKTLDFIDHPSSYKLVSQGKSIALIHGDGAATDLVLRPGHEVIADLEDVFGRFRNMHDREVVDFRHPRQNLAVRPGRMGGWPTIRDTRVPYDTIALLVGDGTVRYEDVPSFYPSVSVQSVEDAVSFANEVEDVGQSA